MTEPAGDLLADPVAAVVAAVTAVDPAVDQHTVRAAVELSTSWPTWRCIILSSLAS